MSNTPFSERDPTKPIKASDISVFAGSMVLLLLKNFKNKPLKLVTQKILR